MPQTSLSQSDVNHLLTKFYTGYKAASLKAQVPSGDGAHVLKFGADDAYRVRARVANGQFHGSVEPAPAERQELAPVAETDGPADAATVSKFVNSLRRAIESDIERRQSLRATEKRIAALAREGLQDQTDPGAILNALCEAVRTVKSPAEAHAFTEKMLRAAIAAAVAEIAAPSDAERFASAFEDKVRGPELAP